MFRCSLEMSTKKSTMYLPTVCPTSKTTIQSGHLARHRREMHGEAPRASDEFSVRSRSSSTETRATERSGWLVGWGLTALFTQNRSYRACKFVGIFHSKL